MRKLVFFFCLFVLFVCSTLQREAKAYAWMIKHGYPICGHCHADPSGGGLLTAYGRAQSEILVTMYYGAGDPKERDPGNKGDFLFGAAKLPDELLLQADGRLLAYYASVGGESDARLIHMQSDFSAQYSLGRLRLNASLGYMHKGAQNAWLLGRGEAHHLVSRVHWVGYDLDEDKTMLIRAGRMNLPFGLRSVEHTFWARSETRTDINASQQHGVAFSYSVEKFRLEGMAVLGNFQISPDSYRDRGVVGFAEYSPDRKLAIGLNLMTLHADSDLVDGFNSWRHSYGAFARYSPAEKWVFSGEWNLLYRSRINGQNMVGLVSYVQADFEPKQGLHLMVTTEALNRHLSTLGTSYGLWGSAAWYFWSHSELRLDLIYRNEASVRDRVGTFMLLAQAHIFL